jgi:hypothetical protein
MITIRFDPWRPFHARKNHAEIHRWLQALATNSKNIFKSGMGSHPPASSPSEYPARRTSSLHGSVDAVVEGMSMTVGSNMFYSHYLRHGTSRMARRKMSDNALREAMQTSRLGRWVEWSLG